ncbi:hypothetical protein LEP1GSC195_1421 [Leptospira wolbachii serovar Codice str. CDC]|uniref:Uncharacterized protein n=1 Tax=Leptospira wolbachii serovar Codice str. CDC TaxID=1218599 RepID=R9ADZ6_9LEPT|nr:hypothetical protein [Leptospira wolbachii]EOQ98315.1 hypothetical protein LEP1GSC195_1421 [Leptospira wolbachii serovar Codice str. CDC]
MKNIITFTLFFISCYSSQIHEENDLLNKFPDINKFSKEKMFSVSFHCNEWYTNPDFIKNNLRENSIYTLCKYSDDKKRIRTNIIGSIGELYVSKMLNYPFLFTTKEVINKRKKLDEIESQNCVGEIHGDEQFMVALRNPLAFKGECINIILSIFYMKTAVSEKNVIFKLTNEPEFLISNFDGFKESNKLKVTLKVLGWYIYNYDTVPHFQIITSENFYTIY